MARTVITLITGSSGNHVLAADLGRRPEFEVRLVTREPTHWDRTIACEERHVVSDAVPFVSPVRVERYRGTIASVHGWDQLGDACEGADMLVLACPVHSHRSLLERIVPVIAERPALLLGSLYAQGGFDWIYRDVCTRLGVALDHHVLFGLKRYPFLCRKTSYGSSVSLMGRFPIIAAALLGGSATLRCEARRLLGAVFGKPVVVLPSFLNCTLNMSNQILHPGLSASILREFVPGVSAFAAPVPFYGSANAAAVTSMLTLVHEFFALGEVLERALGIDLVAHFGVDPAFRCYLQFRRHLGRRLEGVHAYEQLRDHVCALLLRSNRRLEQATLPMTETAAGLVPNFGSRFWLDDIPHGLCVVLGLARLVDVELPETLRLIRLHQRFMGRRYVDETEVGFGPDLSETNAPQRYGVHDRAALREFVRF